MLVGMRAAIFTSRLPGRRRQESRRHPPTRKLPRRSPNGWTGQSRPSSTTTTSRRSTATSAPVSRRCAAVRHGEIDAVICWHPDRLYRRVRDLRRPVDITDRGVQIASVNGGELDLSNSTAGCWRPSWDRWPNRKAHTKGSGASPPTRTAPHVARWRADGPRPFGYTQRGEPLEPEATALRHAVRDILDGRSLRSVCTEWNARGLLTPRAAGGAKHKGGVPWTNPQLRRVLMRPVYAGLRTYGDAEPIKGDWEPLIDIDTHRGLVAFLRDPTARRRQRSSANACCPGWRSAGSAAPACTPPGPAGSAARSTPAGPAPASMSADWPKNRSTSWWRPRC